MGEESVKIDEDLFLTRLTKLHGQFMVGNTRWYRCQVLRHAGHRTLVAELLLSTQLRCCF